MHHYCSTKKGQKWFLALINMTEWGKIDVDVVDYLGYVEPRTNSLLAGG